MLEGYIIGINQMMPNSMSNVFGYIAKCKLKGIGPCFQAFLRLVTLSKVPEAEDGLLALSYKGSYRTVVGKASMWHHWRKKWVVIHTTDEMMYRPMVRWTEQPRFAGKSGPLPLFPQAIGSESLLSSEINHTLRAQRRCGCQRVGCPT